MTSLKVVMGIALAEAVASGQLVNKQEKQLSCESRGFDGRARSCEMREQTTARL